MAFGILLIQSLSREKCANWWLTWERSAGRVFLKEALISWAWFSYGLFWQGTISAGHPTVRCKWNIRLIMLTHSCRMRCSMMVGLLMEIPTEKPPLPGKLLLFEYWKIFFVSFAVSLGVLFIIASLVFLQYSWSDHSDNGWCGHISKMGGEDVQWYQKFHFSTEIICQHSDESSETTWTAWSLFVWFLQCVLLLVR